MSEDRNYVQESADATQASYNTKHRRKKEVRREVKRYDKKKNEKAFSGGYRYDPKQEKKEDRREARNVEKMALQNKNRRLGARQEGQRYAEEVLGRNVQGLTPDVRRAMQYEANQQIARQHEDAQRRLLGEQGRRGIVGGSGVAYAQARDLQRLANEGYGQVNRDINKLNSDLALKKLAAMYAIEQGEAGQADLDRQAALNELQFNRERKRQRQLENQFQHYLTRV